ncbi:MAG: hypothetical protein KAT05_15215, partial [Spirochaetes bacterium]|nr:hypothetical protein [Spirochaetota bacterium]
MNSKRLKNYAKNSAIGIFIVLFMFLPLIQLKPHILPGNTEGNFLNSNQNIPSSQGSYDLTTLPYFENISGVTDWVSSNIIDEATFPVSPSESFYPMYFA